MKRTLLAVLSALLILGCSGYRGLVFRVQTNGMSPTIKAGDTVFCDPIFYKHTPVARGDIVLVKDPDGKKMPDGNVELYAKRIIGLGGDKIQIVAGKVYVNDHLSEGILGSGKYFTDVPVDDFGPAAVPPGQYFLVGDNLPNSLDSRHWKHSTVNLNYIYGKVTAITDHEGKKTRYL